MKETRIYVITDNERIICAATTRQEAFNRICDYVKTKYKLNEQYAETVITKIKRRYEYGGDHTFGADTIYAKQTILYEED